MRRAAALTVRLEEEAYATIVPGITRDHDLATFLKRRMRALGVEDGWSPAQNPSVNSGPDRGHSHASDRVIRPGDVIQTDFGIKVHGVWVTDIQRFALLRRARAPPRPLGSGAGARVRRRGGAAFTAMRRGQPAQVDSRSAGRWRRPPRAVRGGRACLTGTWAHTPARGSTARTRTLASDSPRVRRLPRGALEGGRRRSDPSGVGAGNEDTRSRRRSSLTPNGRVPRAPRGVDPRRRAARRVVRPRGRCGEREAKRTGRRASTRRSCARQLAAARATNDGA